VGLALSGSKSSAYVLQWALAKFAPAGAAFRLIHVLTPVLAVPTERMLHYTTRSLSPASLSSFSLLAHYVFVEMSACGLVSVGNYIPIDKVRPDKSDAYVKMVQLKAQEMLARCKNMCNQNKVV
jgi:hypothetical protein